MSSQLEMAEFALNPEQRCACVLLLDTSGSMQGDKIAALNKGLRVFHDEISKDPLASLRVEVAVVTFDSKVNVVQDFVTAGDFQPPTLTTTGVTFMGGGIQQALDLIDGRKAVYKANGIQYYRPWIVMLTDGEPYGEPDDAVNQAVRRLHDAELNKRVVFFAVGVEGANMARLDTIAPPNRKAVPLSGLKFNELFVWLSASMSAVSNSKLGDQVALPPPSGWASV
jgi:hypothetical protein